MLYVRSKRIEGTKAEKQEAIQNKQMKEKICTKKDKSTY